MAQWQFLERPGDATIPSTGKRSNIFFVGEALTFTLGGTLPAAWKVRDYYGTVVASGTSPGTTLTVAAQPPGWYKLYLERGTSDATWGPSQGECMFVVFRATAGFPSRPAGTSTDRGAVSDYDQAMRGLTLGGMHRANIDNISSPTVALDRAVTDAALETSYYLPFDTNRPKHRVCAFSNGTDTTPAGTATATINTVVDTLGTDRWWYECRNEPQGTSAATFVAELQRFYDNVKAADPAAQVLAPNPVSVNLGGGITWLGQFFAAGGGAYCDGISWHDYNSVNGDLAHGRRVYDRLTTLLTTHGVAGKPRFMSELGMFAATYGSFTPRRQTRWLSMYWMLLEQYGVPKEHFHYYYQASHGYWDFPAFTQTEDLSPMPAVAFMRVWSEELYGKTYAARLDFGTVENLHYLGSRFTNATDGTSVVAVMSAGRKGGSVTFDVTGMASGTLTTVTAFGVETTATVAAGACTLPVDELPVYLRLPTGVGAAPRAVSYGRNLVADGGAANASASVASFASRPISKVVNQIEDSFYDTYAAADAIWEGVSAAFPQWVRVSFWKPQTFDTIVVKCGPPWQNQSVLLNFEVQTLGSDGTTWTTRQSYLDDTKTFPWVGYKYTGAGCYTDTYWDERHLFVVDLGGQVTTSGVRLLISDCSKGGEDALVDGTQRGQGASGNEKRISVKEIEVYNRYQAQNRQVVRASLA